MIAALIVAAGKGVRMGACQPKQYLPLGGRPILLHTLKAFDACPAVDRIVLVVDPGQIAHCRQQVISDVAFRADTILVPGGPRRQDSVCNGLDLLDEDGIVLIHDGVRPLVHTDLINDCIDGARKWGACIPAVPVTDTLKRVDPQGVVERTVPRDALYMAQTPQAFKLSLIKAAHRLARQHHWQATDDASLVEQMGAAVHVIPGAHANIKITTPEDLRRAETLLGRSAPGRMP